MALYEHVFIARPDLSNAQAEALVAHFGEVLTENGGQIVGTEYWGLRTMSYRIKKNRKDHYGFMKSDSPAEAVREMERLMRIHEDVIRVMTVKVAAHEEGPSAILQARSSRDDRRSRRDRDDRPRDDRPREDRPREDRPREDRPREERPRDDRPREDRARGDRPSEDSSSREEA